MFDTICALIPCDPAYPERTRRLDILTRVLEGRLYDVLPYEFHEERGAGGEYIPLRRRRPSIRYPLAKIVVDDSLSLVFGEGHFPTVECSDARTRALLGDIARDGALNQTMLEAALRGSVGSVAVLLRVLSGRVFFRVLVSMFLTPAWKPEAPDELARVMERYKVPGRMLADQGYEIEDPADEFWFQRVWDDAAETWFVPTPVSDGLPSEIDAVRSVQHGLGFVPIVWIKNLPGGDDVDGACTFRPAVETGIEIDYQLSQAGRGLKYSLRPDAADPRAGRRRQRDRARRRQRAGGQREGRREAAGDRRHGGERRDRLCALPARTGAGGRARQPRECGPAERAAERAGARADEPGPDLARRQSAGQLRRRAAATGADGRAGLARSIRWRCSAKRWRRWIRRRRFRCVGRNWYPPDAPDRQSDAATLTTLDRRAGCSAAKRR